MTLLVVGTFRLPPSNILLARSAMLRMVEASRAEDGCIEYSYAEDMVEPGLIRVQEHWRDQPSLHRHFASEHIAAWRAEWATLGICNRNLKLYEVGAPFPN